MVLAYIDRDPEHMKYLFMFLFAALSMSFAGIMDDIIGNRNVSGLKGHFKSLFKGTLTTGGFKALYGGFVGLLISVVLTRSIPEIVLNTLIIALSTNLMNLMDLRPGRAIKVYLVIMIVMIATLTGFTRTVVLTRSIPEIVLNTLIIALSTNLMNLMDLRPGRAIKVYLLIMIVRIATLTGFTRILPFLIVPAVLAYFNQDLTA